MGRKRQPKLKPPPPPPPEKKARASPRDDDSDDDKKMPAAVTKTGRPQRAAAAGPKCYTEEYVHRPVPDASSASTTRRKKLQAGSLDRGDGFADNTDLDKIPPEQDPIIGDDDWAFCCADCKCSDEQKKKYRGTFSPGNNTLWHHRCCHNSSVICERGINEDHAFPVMKAHNKFAPWLTVDANKCFEKEPVVELFSPRQVYKRFKIMRRQVSQLHNEDALPTLGSMMQTDIDYKTNIYNRYMDLKKERNSCGQKHPCVVLDLFAGIGTGIVVLKRLKIAIRKVIHCEHDKIASYVYRYNHDASYNDKLWNDEIVHVHEFNTFEDLDNNLANILRDHGPIDIVLGGPPCTDFSTVNATRQGLEGFQGNYLLAMAQLVNRIKSHELQCRKPLFFLAENVPIQGEAERAMHETALHQICKAFGISTEYQLDAKYYSPCIRNRVFFTNIPILSETTYEAKQHPKECLKKGDFKVASDFFDKDLQTPKISTFMASTSRLNCHRMFVFQECEIDGKEMYKGRALNIEERELMMGYKAGYVENAVTALFKDILIKGLFSFSTFDPWNKNKAFCQQYHNFRGAYHGFPDGFKFEPTQVSLGVKLPLLQMAPPIPWGSQQDPSFFDHDDYSKHLIGNAYSVPVVEAILKPLCDLFSQKEYDGYVYSYEWE